MDRLPSAVALVSGDEVGGRSPPGASTGTQTTTTAIANAAAARQRRPGPERSARRRRAAAARIGASQIAPAAAQHPDQGRAGDGERDQRPRRAALVGWRTPPARRPVATSAAPATSLMPAPQVVAEEQGGLRGEEGDAPRAASRADEGLRELPQRQGEQRGQKAM